MEEIGLRRLEVKMGFKVDVKDAKGNSEKRKRRMGKLAFKKNSPENLLLEIIKLEPIEFLGICKIVGVDIMKPIDTTVEDITEADEEGGQATAHVKVNVEPREFNDIWEDLCDKLEQMNRVRRRNLGKLVYAATKKEKEK